MKKSRSLLSSLCLCALASNVSASVLDIDFNGTQFLLGTFESAETGADFYRYGNPFGASANPIYPGTGSPIPLRPDALQIFTHTDTSTSTNSLSFGVILEKPNGSGGGSFAADVDWSSPAVLTFVDDPGETGSLGQSGPQSIVLNWVNCCTDGFVVGGLDPENLFLNLTNVTGSDLREVIFLSPDGPSANTRFAFPDEAFSISVAACDPQTDPDGCEIAPPAASIPEPGTVALFGLGLFALSWSITRERKKQSAVVSY